MTPREDEERRRWYRDLWIFLGVFFGVPAALALPFFVPALVLPLVALLVTAGVVATAGRPTDSPPTPAYVAARVALVLGIVGAAIVVGPWLLVLIMILLTGGS